MSIKQVTEHENPLNHIGSPPYFCEVLRRNSEVPPGFYIITKIKVEAIVGPKTKYISWYYLYEAKKWISSNDVVVNKNIFPN